MSDNDKTKEQLIEELAELRRQNAELVKMSPDEACKQTNKMMEEKQNLLNMIIEEAPT